MQRKVYGLLPAELIDLILEFMSFKDLASLALVNSEIKSFVDNHVVADKYPEQEPVSFQAYSEHTQALRSVAEKFKALQRHIVSTPSEKLSEKIHANTVNPVGLLTYPLRLFLPSPARIKKKRKEKLCEMHLLESKLVDPQMVLRKRPG